MSSPKLYFCYKCLRYHFYLKGVTVEPICEKEKKIKEIKGKCKDKLTSSDEFEKNKKEEKNVCKISKKHS